MSQIKLVNPAGEEKMFEDNYEFDKFLGKFVTTSTFQTWAFHNQLPGSFKHNGKEVVNTLVVKQFLKEKGYVISRI